MQQYEAHLCLALIAEQQQTQNTSQKFTRLYRKSPKGRILCSSFARIEKKKHVVQNRAKYTAVRHYLHVINAL